MSWTAQYLCLFTGVFVADCISAGKQCREERSINGMALQGFVFKKILVRAFHECDISCERELTCQSFNFVVGEKSCELNNRTKEARLENLRKDPARSYMRRLVQRAPLGSIPELPAHSCQEIKAGEGKNTISSKYWLEPNATGTAVLVYCDMDLEDIDECKTGSHNCDANANCTNTVGGHNCTCKEGFAGDGRLCSDLNECDRKTNDCHQHASCTNELGSYSCKCDNGFTGDGIECRYDMYTSCSKIRTNGSGVSGNYVIDPDGAGGLPPFTVYCDMSDKNGVGVTVISHDSENRTCVDGFEARGSYSRDIQYAGANLLQLASLTSVSSHCEQFIKYECLSSRLMFNGGLGWWVSRDSAKMNYWGGASPGSGKCACGMTNSCADPRYGCNCDANDDVWREDSGLLTDKTHLPVEQLRFGDTGGEKEEGYHTLGKLKCYGIA